MKDLPTIPINTDPKTIRHLETMRYVNALAVFNRICAYPEGASRPELCNDTGLSPSTISAIVEQLRNADLVRYCDAAIAERPSRQKGRPPSARYFFNADTAYVIGIDLGRTHLRLHLANVAGTVITTYAAHFSTSKGPERAMAQVAQGIKVLLEQADALPNATVKAHAQRVIAICMSIPAPLDTDGRVAFDVHDMRGWTGAPLADLLTTHLPRDLFATMPSTYIDNDANLGAVGASHWDMASRASTVVYIKLGLGVGSGILIDGQVYRGNHGVAGELGHVLVDPSGPRCLSCNKNGCLEAYASARVAIKAAHRARNERFSLPHGQPLRKELQLIADRALAEDEACIEILCKIGNALGKALSVIVNLIDPGLIVLDGDIVHLAGEFLLEPMRDALHQHVPAAAQYQIVLALPDSAIGQGAIATAIGSAWVTYVYQALETVKKSAKAPQNPLNPRPGPRSLLDSVSIAEGIPTTPHTRISNNIQVAPLPNKFQAAP